jgi:hypothetical protein
MEQQSRDRRENRAAGSIAEPSPWEVLWIAVPLLGLLTFWRWRHARHGLTSV